MKNLSPIITIFLAVGLVVLYILHFAGGKGTTTSPEEKVSTPVDTNTIVLEGDISIAYINTDTLMEQYDMALEMKKEIEEKQEKITKDLEYLQNQYLKKEQEFMEKYKRNGFLSQKSLEAAQLELQEELQQLEVYKNEKSNELIEYTNDVNYQLIDSLQNFLNEFNSDYRFQIVLNNSAISQNVIQAHPALDITDTVVLCLNKRFRASKGL